MVVAVSTPNRNLRVDGHLYNQKRVGKNGLSIGVKRLVEVIAVLPYAYTTTGT